MMILRRTFFVALVLLRKALVRAGKNIVNNPQPVYLITPSGIYRVILLQDKVYVSMLRELGDGFFRSLHIPVTFEHELRRT
jgi:hypothetical protein